MNATCVAVVGLGYVGLPLATAFAQHLPTIGFDLNLKRIQALRQGADWNGELSADTLSAPHLLLTDDPSRLHEASFLIVAVPTPIDRAKRPDLGPLIEASRLVGAHLRPGAIVVYESTVYPGCTEEVCIPMLEQASGLKAGHDFTVGYSPERINPGDAVHTLDPYYLTHKAEEVGYHPDVILAGRRINDAIGRYVARETVRLLIQAGKVIKGARVLVLGLAFKANVRDARNTRVLELIDELTQHGLDVAVTDPLVGSTAIQQHGLKEAPDPFGTAGRYDALILAVPHQSFLDQPAEAYLRLLKDEDGPGVVVDIKGVLRDALQKTNLPYWSL